MSVPAFVQAAANVPWLPWPLGVAAAGAIATSGNETLISIGRVPYECATRYPPLSESGQVILTPLPLPDWCQQAFQDASTGNLIFWGVLGVIGWLVWIAVSRSLNS